MKFDTSHFFHDFKMSEETTMFFPNIVLPWLITTCTPFYFRSVTGFTAMNVFFKHIKTNGWKNIHFRSTFRLYREVSHFVGMAFYTFCPPIRSQAVPSWSLPSSLHVSPSNTGSLVSGNRKWGVVSCCLPFSHFRRLFLLGESYRRLSSVTSPTTIPLETDNFRRKNCSFANFLT